MPNIRPAGLSDEDTDSDDCYFERSVRKYVVNTQISANKKFENDLQEAILNGDLEQIMNFVRNDLNNNVNVRLDSSWTPLMHACFHGQDKVVKYLLETGADTNMHCDSVTPLMVACSNSSVSNDSIQDVVGHLLEHGCILNIGDKYGQTPLMRAIGSGRVGVVDMLLDQKVNIEMRDNQGWTAVFWAAHHNQPDILDMLIHHGARLTEVDKFNRTILEIAESHDFGQLAVQIKEHLGFDASKEDGKCFLNNELVTWHEFYPGVQKGGRPNYASEIPHLLYGMNCEKLAQKVEGMDLRTFLLLDEEQMINLGIDMPYERQRLKVGLRNFHTKTWKLNSVAGLYARKTNNFTVLECLTTLGAHLHQVCILEATLQYVLREYINIQNQIKFEPPDSPIIVRMQAAVKKMLVNINSIRNEGHNMRKILTKISHNNPRPADLVRNKPRNQVIKQYVADMVLVCTIGLIAYNYKYIIQTLLRK